MKAVIYARYSSDSQREESIEGQLRECKDFAERNDFTILNTYIDRALSAKSDNRPAFQQMVKDSSKGLFDIAIVWKLDRFARKSKNASPSALPKKKSSPTFSQKKRCCSGCTNSVIPM
jgi:DNA invertase Pin-like site-specific DNA recombinase